VLLFKYRINYQNEWNNDQNDYANQLNSTLVMFSTPRATDTNLCKLFYNVIKSPKLLELVTAFFTDDII